MKNPLRKQEKKIEKEEHLVFIYFNYKFNIGHAGISVMTNKGMQTLTFKNAKEFNSIIEKEKQERKINRNSKW